MTPLGSILISIPPIADMSGFVGKGCLPSIADIEVSKHERPLWINKPKLELSNEKKSSHFAISTRSPALAPTTPFLYIVSAIPGGCVNAPAVCALARKAKR